MGKWERRFRWYIGLTATVVIIEELVTLCILAAR